MPSSLILSYYDLYHLIKCSNKFLYKKVTSKTITKKGGAFAPPLT